MVIDDYITIDVLGALPPLRWRELCRALWYARGAVMSIRRVRGRVLGRRRPAWQWRGGSGVPYPRIEDVSALIDLPPGSVFGFVPRPHWRALAVLATQDRRAAWSMRRITPGIPLSLAYGDGRPAGLNS